MSWSKIKNAINSTIGTKDFKPLDRIVGDAFDTIVSEQNSIKRKLSTGENDFYVDRAKNVDISGFLGVLEEYRAAKIATGSYVGTSSSHIVSIVLPFEPKAIMIFSPKFNNNSAMFVFSRVPSDNGLYFVKGVNGIGTDSIITSVAGDTVTIEVYDPTGSMQAVGKRCDYIAFG